MDQLNKEIDLSIDAERKVARSFMGRVEWEMIVIGLGQFIVWITTWILVIKGVIPLWAGFIISLNYIEIPGLGAQRPKDITFPASIFTGALATFGLQPNNNEKKKKNE